MNTTVECIDHIERELQYFKKLLSFPDENARIRWMVLEDDVKDLKDRLDYKKGKKYEM